MTLDPSQALATLDAGTAVAGAVARRLPLDATPDVPLDERDAATLLAPGEGARAVSATVHGAGTGTLVVVLSADAALALTIGPLGAADLPSALQPALDESAQVLTQLLGAPVSVDAAYELPAEICLPAAGATQSLFAARLLGPTGHVAGVALSLGQPEPVAIPAPREAHAFAPLPSTTGPSGSSRPLELLHDVEMGVTVELGRTRMSVRDLLSLAPGAIVELDRAAGSPVDMLVNGTLIARGEVVVIDEEFGIRVSEIVGARVPSPEGR